MFESQNRNHILFFIHYCNNIKFFLSSYMYTESVVDPEISKPGARYNSLGSADCFDAP